MQNSWEISLQIFLTGIIGTFSAIVAKIAFPKLNNKKFKKCVLEFPR